MRRSTIALGLGGFLTLVLVWCWGLTWYYHSVHFYVVPQGIPPKPEDRCNVYGVGLDGGCVYSFWKYRGWMPRGGSNYFGGSFSRVEVPPWERRRMPSGHFYYGMGGECMPDPDSRVLYVPIWMFVVPLVAGTRVAFLRLRRREAEQSELAGMVWRSEAGDA